MKMLRDSWKADSVRLERWLRLGVLVLVLGLAGCKRYEYRSEGVELALSTNLLEPTTTFELRFNEAVAGPAELGRPAPESPLVITPPLKGAFVWLSSAVEGTANAPVLPTLQLLFNAAVTAEAAAHCLSFRSGDARTVPARVTQTTSAENQPVPNAVTVIPERPLPAGHGWKLVLAAGLPSPETKARLRKPFELAVGDMQAFRVTGAKTHNSVGAGKRIEITFSKSPPHDPESTNFLEWVSVTPAPTNLAIDAGWHSLWLRGNFSSTNLHVLTVRAGLPAEEPVTLAETYMSQLHFEPIPPRLYFGEFAAEQLSIGRREFPLLAVNVDHVEVRAKLLNRDTLIHALRGYSGSRTRWMWRGKSGCGGTTSSAATAPGTRSLWH